jgi:hypothetical protein
VNRNDGAVVSDTRRVAEAHSASLQVSRMDEQRNC